MLQIFWMLFTMNFPKSCDFCHNLNQKVHPMLEFTHNACKKHVQEFVVRCCLVLQSPGCSLETKNKMK